MFIEGLPMAAVSLTGEDAAVCDPNLQHPRVIP